MCFNLFKLKKKMLLNMIIEAILGHKFEKKRVFQIICT